MQDRFLTKRVEVLENTLLGPDGVVEQLGLIRAELSAMRQEMHGGFAAVRQEMDGKFVVVHQKVDSGFVAVHQKMDSGFAAVRREMNERFDVERRHTSDEIAAVHQAITQVDVHMRLLHEDAIDRIANSRRDLATDTPSVKKKSTSTSRRKTR